MESNAQLLDPADAVDVAIRSGVSRRDALRQAAMFSATLAASPFALAALSSRAYGQTPEVLPQSIKDVLSFALTLEHLEYEFYVAGVAAADLIAEGETDVFTTIRNHEREHVIFLQNALALTPGVGEGAAGRPEFGFDFTGAPGGLALDTFTNYQTFLAVSQGLEDTGVRAYKGQAGEFVASDALASNPLVSATLQAALQIHSVEGRHAAAVRLIRGQKGWITGNDRGGLPAEFQGIYDGEDAAVSVSGYTAAQITEAFDEPLTKAQVLPIAGVFIRTSAP